MATTTNERLTELETRIFGEDCVRGPDGLPLERGAGSAFAKASDQDKALHAALVALVAAEAEVATAEAKVVAVKQAAEAAEKAAAEAAKKAEPKIEPQPEPRPEPMFVQTDPVPAPPFAPKPASKAPAPIV